MEKIYANAGIVRWQVKIDAKDAKVTKDTKKNLALRAKARHVPARSRCSHIVALLIPAGSLTTTLGSAPILHHMVKYGEARLDRTFAALADPTRRAILARLAKEGSASVSELANPFAIKLPAVMKHLDVLGAAGLISRSKQGRTVIVRLAPEPIREAMDWLHRYKRFWSVRLDRLAAYAESQEARARKERS